MVLLTDEQLARIEFLASDAWIVDTGSSDDEAKSWENFDLTLSQMSSIELHHFASHFNWDGGTEELSRVLEHPLCDAGTALLIFWLGEPLHYFRRAAKGMLAGDHERQAFLFLKNIQDRLTGKSFRSACIAFDPKNFLGQRRASDSSVDHEYISGKMFEPTPGEFAGPFPL